LTACHESEAYLNAASEERVIRLQISLAKGSPPLSSGLLQEIVNGFSHSPLVVFTSAEAMRRRKALRERQAQLARD
jgi:hypothetical protein